MRAFFHVWENDEGFLVLDRTEATDMQARYLGYRRGRKGHHPEIQKFFATAAVGDVFQLQENEYIIALGNLIRASWLR